jgi:hypothetical protein
VARPGFCAAGVAVGGVAGAVPCAAEASM